MTTTTSTELQENLKFFRNNQADLVAQHNGKILLVYRQRVINAFPDYAEAYAVGMGSYAPGDFSLISCFPGPEAYTVGFSNLAHFAKPVNA